MEFVFKVTEQEGNLLIAALAKQPYETVIGLIHKLQHQAQEQMKAHLPAELAK
jgi:hypothetical protein